FVRKMRRKARVTRAANFLIWDVSILWLPLKPVVSSASITGTTHCSLYHYARTELSFRKRPLRDDRPADRRQAADARLQHCQPVVGRASGIPVDQGAGRCADQASAESESRRRSAGGPQADWHASDFRSA